MSFVSSARSHSQVLVSGQKDPPLCGLLGATYETGGVSTREMVFLTLEASATLLDWVPVAAGSGRFLAIENLMASERVAEDLRQRGFHLLDGLKAGSELAIYEGKRHTMLCGDVNSFC